MPLHPERDTILVKAGTYEERVELKSGVDVLGAGFKSTIVKGRRLANTVFANEVTDAVFDGFTVADGSQNIGYAGIRVIGGSPVISNCLITNNLRGVSSAADLDNSGTVDGEDLSIFAEEYGNAAE